MTEPTDAPLTFLGREAWQRQLCPLCGRFSIRRHLDINSRVARQATYWCVQGHRWMTTWERP